jgi:hypothetical protein
MGIDTLNAALQRVEHHLKPFTLHELRRTARTHLTALGIRREVAERCLGHSLRGVEGTYDRHDYFVERRAALAQWTSVTRNRAWSAQGNADTPYSTSRDVHRCHRQAAFQSSTIAVRR